MHEDRLQTQGLVEDICDRYGPELTVGELETLANALLKAHGPDEQYPHLPDANAHEGGTDFAFHSLEDERSPRTWEARDLQADPPASLPGTTREKVQRLLSAANLTGRRRRVARLRLWGYTSRQIAGLLGLELAVIYLEWRGAKRALRLALASGDWDCGREPGISAVDARELFRDEQRKRIYRKPSHCADGKEKCRRTGVCKYAG